MGEGPVAILAGSGTLPLELADHLRTAGRPVRLLAFRGFADRETRSRADKACDLLDPQSVFDALDAWSPAAVTLVGGVRRPRVSAALGAFAALRQRHELAAILAKGDDHLLRAALHALEERGHRIVGPHELAPHLAAPAGFAGARRPDASERTEIDRGLAVLNALSPFDVGQAVAVAGGRVLAIEGPEGTDCMLRRVASLRRSWLRRRERGGILLKAPKQGQDLRIDLPAIGPRTLREAARAGLSGIAVAAGRTLILDRAATLAAADRLGLFLVSVGLPHENDDG